MTKSPLRTSLALARARRQIQRSSGEFSTPTRSDVLMGGGDQEMLSSAPPIVVGDEIAYVRDPKAICLALIGSGGTCCLNGKDCPVVAHKSANNRFVAENPFFVELHQGHSAKGYKKGYTLSCLRVTDDVDDEFVQGLLRSRSVHWKSRFENLKSIPAEELTSTVVNHMEMLQRTAIKTRPNLKEESPSQSPTVAQEIIEELVRVDALTKELLDGVVGMSTCPEHLRKDLLPKPGNEDLKECSDEIFMQLYKLSDLVGALSQLMAMVQEDVTEASSLKGIVEGLSLAANTVQSTIGFRPSYSTLAPDIWNALMELEVKLEEQEKELSMKIGDVNTRADEFFALLDAEDADTKMGGCESSGQCDMNHECCSSCTQNFNTLNKLVKDLQDENDVLHQKIRDLDRDEVSSDQVGTFAVQGIIVTSRSDVAAQLLEWFPDDTEMEPAFFPTPHLLWNLVWSNVSNNQNGMKLPFSDSELLKMKINKRSAEAFYSTQSYLPQFMTADSLPSGFPPKSSKSDRLSSQAFKSIPTAADFGRSGDSDFLHGKFRKGLNDVSSQYKIYLEQKLYSHKDTRCYLIAKQCLDDAVDHIGYVLEFMEDQNYRNVRSFGQEKKTLAWNLVSACVREVYEQHFKGCMDLVVSNDLSNMANLGVDVTYAALSLNQLVRDLNRIGLKHHPSVSTSQLRFVMESYAESGDDSAKIKKLEKDNENLSKRVEKQEEENDKFKRKLGDLASLVSNMKKNKKQKRGAADDEEE